MLASICDIRVVFLNYYYNNKDNYKSEGEKLSAMHQETVRKFIIFNSKNYFKEVSHARAQSPKLSM